MRLTAAAIAILSAPALLGHAVSMSTGELVIEGSRATYTLRLPLYEAAHIGNPAIELLKHVSFASGGRAARMIDSSCAEESRDASYRCRASYEFASPPGSVTVNCTYPDITVPNHVHVLKASKDGAEDQAVLDFTFRQKVLTFHPASTSAPATGLAGGAPHAISGVAQVVFLAALALAGRTRRELWILAFCFLAAQSVAAILGTLTAWEPAARFVEAAAALTIAYLAVEILFFPESGQRWAVLLFLGAIHGLYFSILLRAGAASPAYLLAGASVAQACLIFMFAGVWSLIRKFARAIQPDRVASAMMLAAGLGWFFLRLRS